VLPTVLSGTPEPSFGAAAVDQVADTCKQATAELHQQMLDSTELIKTLAEQNTQLVRRVESNRKRLLWLALLVSMLAVWSVIKLYS
jgi:type IV secretory pathway component VirB8